MPSQLLLGFRCFLGHNSQPGDTCGGATLAMFSYVLVNFCYNVLLLLITKHGSAMLLVISTALALPITNTAFRPVTRLEPWLSPVVAPS